MKFNWIEIRGFRSFGTVTQKVELSPIFTLVRAENSQGKTSFSEAVEFLLAGTTSRRNLHAGTKTEFEGCLRNAHLDSSEEVWVRAEVELDDGTTGILRRNLTADYNGASECESELLYNGQAIETVENIGFKLSGHSLASPVLQQHVLHYVSSAGPQERGDYFKALLDLSDLENVRRLLTEHASTLGSFTSVLLGTLLRVMAVELYATDTRAVLVAKSYEELESKLIAVGSIALAETGEEEIFQTLPEIQSKLDEIVKSRVAKIISIEDVTTTELSELSIQDIIQSTARYQKSSAEIDLEVSRLIPIFNGILKIPAIEHAEHEGQATDCPVCGSTNGLDAAKISGLRKSIAANATHSAEAATTTSALNRTSASLTTSFTSINSSKANTSGWTDEYKEELEGKILALDIPVELVKPFLTETYAINVSADALEASGKLTRQKLSEVIKAVQAQTAINQRDIDTLAKELREYVGKYEALKSKIDTHLLVQVQIQESINKRVEEQSGTKNWSDILSLFQQSDELLVDIEKARQVKATKLRYERATKEIDDAIVEVFNAKFGTMSDEIIAWWSTLRPDELTSFDGVSMRGSGRRYFDLKAELKAFEDTSGVKKDAVSVFSDSQLNALGLSAFLARCSMQATPFIMLDDPIPSGDEEHRMSFATTTMEKLFETNAQIIVTVFDTTMAQQLKDYHRMRGIKYYEIVLSNPIDGSSLKNVGDKYHNAIATAKSLLVNPDDDSRRTAGQNLRRATERLAKMIIVAKTIASGGTASTADYDGKTIGELQPLVAPFAAVPAEAGSWSVLARELNRSDHDDNPPTQIALRNCFSALRKIERDHPEIRSISD